MADATVSSPAPRRRRGWLRAVAWIVGSLVVLLLVLYFVATSSAGFKSLILPRVGAALNAKVTVSDASLHPFREVVLHDLKVQTTGAEPLVSAPEVRLRYSLMDIIRGNIRVDEVTLNSPTVVLVENPDKTSNLDPILKAQKAKPAPPQKPAPPSKPAQIDIRKVALVNGTVRQVKLYAGGQRDVTELANVNVTATDLKNGQTGKLALGADIKMDNNPPPPQESGAMQAKLNGNFTLALTPDLKPGSVQGNTRLAVTGATGALAQVAALNANLDCDVVPTAIKEVALRFQKGETRLGEILVSGPFDMEKVEGRLTVQVLNIDKNLLNLAGASSGLDFGPTTINSTNEIQVAKAGSMVTAAGQFNLNRLQLTRTNQTTPPLDLRAEYNVTVDQAASNAVLRTLTLTGTQKETRFLEGQLTSPMTISWGKANSEVGDSTFKAAVTHLNLADWKAFLGEVAPAGDVNGTLSLLSQQGGKQLSFELNSQIDQLTAGSGSNQITQATVTLQMRGQATELKQFKFPEYKLQVARQNQPLVIATGSGTYDQASESADMQLNAQLLLARLFQALPRPDINVSSGSAELKVRLTQRQKTQNVTGNLALADFTGKFGSNVFSNFGTTAELDVGMTPQQVEIRKIAGKVTEGQAVGGTFELTGTYDLANKSAQLKAKLANFNQNGLRPFLEPMLADKKLVSVALNGNAATEYNPQGASAVKAELQVTNLVVNDPTGRLPATPLGAALSLDASVNQQVADVRQCQLALTPTARATNQVQLSGQVDMSRTNAITGHLKLLADLDLTSYYDLFVGQKKAPEAQPAATAAPTTTPAPAAAPEKEPEAKQLPFRDFIAEANIRRLYLREVEITDFQTTTKLNGGQVVLNPFKLTLNGAPVNTTVNLDLGVPGYKYDMSFNAQAVPLAPLVNTFQPERKGQIGGTFTGQAKLSGAGITGAGLQKNLSGQFYTGATNLNLSVINVQNPLLKGVINVVATLPELVRNPGGAVSGLVGAVAPKAAAGSSGGLADELQKSPINTVVARGAAGAGQVKLEQALVQSSAFQAEATGTITLAPVLTNSTLHIPVSLSLSRPLAERLNLAANAPANAAYVKLPDFVTEVGSVGNPKSDINYKVLAGTLGKSMLGGVPGGSKAGNVIQGFLGGGAAGGANAPPNAATNPPAQQQSPVGGFLNQLLKPKK